MKKVFKVLGFLFAAFVVFILSAFIASTSDTAAGVVAAIYMVAMFALPFVLIGLLVRHFVKKKRTAEPEPLTAPEPFPIVPKAQQPAPVVQTQPVTPAKKAISKDDLDDILATCTDDPDIEYRYTDVGVYMPDVSVMIRDDFEEGASLTFKQEPSNKYDPRSVAVRLKGKRIGYLYRGKLRDMVNDWLERGDKVRGRISLIHYGAKDKSKYGVRIDIDFYYPED